MTRATETANIILESLDMKDVEKCDMIREGAPIPPEPPIGHWRPELHVTIKLLKETQYQILKFLSLFSSFILMDLELKPHSGSIFTELLLSRLKIVTKYMCAMLT